MDSTNQGKKIFGKRFQEVPKIRLEFSTFWHYLHSARIIFGVVIIAIQSLSHVQLFVTLWTATQQAFLSCNYLPEFAQFPFH